MRRNLIAAAILALFCVGYAFAASFVLTKTGETGSTISFSYPRQTGADGYRYYAPGAASGNTCTGTMVSRTFDPTRTSVRFGKVASGAYCVEAVVITPIGSGQYPASIVDTTPPAIPVLSLGPVTQTSLVLNWQAGSDNIGVDHYNVYRGTSQLVADQAKIAESNALTFTYGGLTCGTDYSLGLTVEDAAGNTSALSQAIWFPVRTLACDQPPPPPPPPPGTELNGWQVTPQNVGLAPFGLSCASLPVYTTNPVPAGAHILRRRIAISGILNLDAGGITIEQSCIQPTGGNVTERMVQSYAAATPNKIIDSEIDASLLGQQSAAFTCAVRGIYGELSRNYMHGMGSGICHVSYNSSLSYDAVYVNNWVGGLRGYGDPGGTGSHNEAATTRCARIDINPNRRMVWRGNWIQTDTPGNSSGGLFIQTTWGCPIGNLYVQNNLLDGGPNWDVYADGTGYSGKFEATNNRFAPGGYGACTVSGFNWTLWTDNYVYAPSNQDGKGAQVGDC